MRILVVSVSFPAPARSGGERRLSALLRGLAADNELGIVALRSHEPDPERLREFAYVDLVAPAPRPRPLPYPLSALRVWWNLLFAPVPLFASGSHTAVFKDALDKAVATFRPDVAYVEPADVAHAVPVLKRAGIPVCFGAIEVVSDKSRHWISITRDARARFAGRRELARTERLERSAFGAADAVVCVSEQDRALIRSWTGKDAVVAPNAVDAASFAPTGVERDRSNVVMVGPATYFANLDATQWFAADTLPALPNVKVDVIGDTGGVSHDLGSAVRFLGPVDDVRPHLASAGALVAPLRIGGGTRLKILEALAMETPVVTTTLGAEGLNVRHREHLLIADDPQSFAAAVQEVLSDPALAARLGKAGRELVVRSYGWKQSVDALEHALARIAQPASRTRS